MEFLADFGLFALKTLLIFGVVIGGLITVLALISQSAGRNRGGEPHLEVQKLNSRFRTFKHILEEHLMGKKEYKKFIKDERKLRKGEDDQPREQRVFVIDFDGDIRASQVESLREEVTAILTVAKPTDEVVIRLESGGGMVTSYGLAASQLDRIREQKIKLTICIDKVAASGGYMMACVGERILAAPFAVVGSIGVIAQLPNLNRVLKKYDVDYREVTAGEFKRTVSVFGELTEPGLAKFREQIEGTHSLFKNFVQQHRPQLDIQRIATGEHWYALEAKDLGLVDEILTSDAYLVSRAASADIYKVSYEERKKLLDRLSEAVAMGVRSLVVRLLSDADRSRLL
jgi:serine protease SohB